MKDSQLRFVRRCLYDVPTKAPPTEQIFRSAISGASQWTMYEHDNGREYSMCPLCFHIVVRALVKGNTKFFHLSPFDPNYD